VNVRGIPVRPPTNRLLPLRKMRIRPAWLLLGLFAGATALHAQAPPLSAEFVANTYSTNAQTAPAVASDGHGRFVVVWDSSGEDGDLDGIFGQRFDALGARAGLEFDVNTYTTNAQFLPRVAMSGSGDFVVVWESAGGQDGSQTGIFGQRFDAAGAKIGAEFPVNTSTTNAQGEPVVAMDDAGEFVVVWSSFGQDGSGYGIFGQRFGSNGVKSGSEFPVNTYTTGDQHEPSVAMDGSGNFVVVWSSFGQDGDAEGVFGQRFDGTGNPRGSEFPVNTHTASDETHASVVSDRLGNFVVAWSDHNIDESSYAIVFRQFHADGEIIGGEHLANSYTTNSQNYPSIAIGPDGGFVITWASYQQDGSSWGTFGQQYDRLGGALNLEFQLNTYTTDAQDGGRVAVDGTGFVAVWNGPGQDGSGPAIVGRRQNVRPVGIDVDVHGIGTSDLNGVFEPGEAIRVEPKWANQSKSDFAGLEGNATNFYGPAGPTYTLLDGAASYGTLLSNSLATCNDSSVAECYAVQAGSVPRPAQHWDTVLPENLSIGGTHYWILHVGDSFSDVPRSHPFYKRIETLLHNGITSGCNATQYCPGDPVSRDQMGIFIAKGIAGAGVLVPAAGRVGASLYNCSPGGSSLFSDVAPTDSFCKHVHLLAAQNVTLGCVAGQYCPSQTVTRDAMASFIAKAIVAPGGGNSVPLTYTDPGTGRSYSCSAASPNLHFTDVPTSNAFCKHIHYLWARDVIAGCSATQYCPTQSVTRDAMAKFLDNAFGFQLYGP